MGDGGHWDTEVDLGRGHGLIGLGFPEGPGDVGSLGMGDGLDGVDKTQTILLGAGLGSESATAAGLVHEGGGRGIHGERGEMSLGGDGGGGGRGGVIALDDGTPTTSTVVDGSSDHGGNHTTRDHTPGSQGDSRVSRGGGGGGRILLLKSPSNQEGVSQDQGW